MEPSEQEGDGSSQGKVLHHVVSQVTPVTILCCDGDGRSWSGGGVRVEQQFLDVFHCSKVLLERQNSAVSTLEHDTELVQSLL